MIMLKDYEIPGQPPIPKPQVLRDGGGVNLARTPVHITLYADDIVLVSESQEGLQQHFQILDDFCTRRGLIVNLGKTKVLIFYTSRQGEDQEVSQKKCRLPYNDLCIQLPETKFRLCLHKTLEVLFDLMCSYFSMMRWQPPPKVIEGSNFFNELERSAAGGAQQQNLATDKESKGNNGYCVDNTGNNHTLQISANAALTESDQGSEGAKADLSNVPPCSTSALVIEDGTQNFILGENSDIAKAIDEAVVEGSLSDLTESLRRETVSSVSKALDKGRKHVWELAARRVSALLSCDALCATSPHHFLQSLDWVNRFVLAGEAFSGAEAVSLRAKLVKLCEKYFGSFHRQNLEVLRMMLEKETWQQLSPAATKTVNLAGLLGDGAAVLVASPVGLPRVADSRLPHAATEQALLKSNEDHAGFAVWLDRGNLFADKKSQGLGLFGNQGGAVDRGSLSNGTVEQHAENNGEVDDDENEDLLADFIDEDSQLPSRVYKSFKQISSRDGQPNIVDDENLILTGSAVGILRQSLNTLMFFGSILLFSK
ncbi:hypothetical protein L7F22_068566 [Adiantum nelumboides]|nr:hypothetical protein [Adiantum nelumboides]